MAASDRKTNTPQTQQNTSQTSRDKGIISGSELRVRHRPEAHGRTTREVSASQENLVATLTSHPVILAAGILTAIALIVFVLSQTIFGSQKQPVIEDKSTAVSTVEQGIPVTAIKETTTYVKTPSLYSTGADNTLTIVLDPGHGGDDSGAYTEDLEEKDLTFKIAEYCKEELEKCPEIKVYLTRTGDYDVSLTDRVQYALSVNADLLVSLHIDDIDVTTEDGATVYYPNGISTWMHDETVPVGRHAAACILNELIALGLRSNDIREAILTPEECSSQEEWLSYAYDDATNTTDYYSIIRTARREGLPGLVVEHCYLSDENDAARLHFDSFVKALGLADAKGILACFGYVPQEELEAKVVNGFSDLTMDS